VELVEANAGRVVEVSWVARLADGMRAEQSHDELGAAATVFDLGHEVLRCYRKPMIGSSSHFV
jgi:hypothetical protein